MRLRLPAESPEEAAARLQRWQNVLLLIAIFVALQAIPVYVGHNLIEAEPVTITVEFCDRSGPKATQSCRGSWTLADGTTVTGGVGGSSLRQGTQIDGWGNRHRATSDPSTWQFGAVMSGSCWSCSWVRSAAPS